MGFEPITSYGVDLQSNALTIQPRSSLSLYFLAEGRIELPLT